MSQLLLDDRPLIVLPMLAKTVGLNEAIILQQLHWRLGADTAQVGEDGRRWWQASITGWLEDFPFWSESTVKRAFDELVERGVVLRERVGGGNRYSVDYERLGQLDLMTGSYRPERSVQNEPSPSKREEGKEQEELFATEPVAAATPTDDVTEKVWQHYVALFGERLRVKALTDRRRKMIARAVKAVTDDDGPHVDVLIDAISGLKSYRDANPKGSKNVDLSVVFETGPHSQSNLTDQIEWWANQKGGDFRATNALSHVPQVHKALVSEHMQKANRAIQGRAIDPDSLKEARDSIDWLRENYSLQGTRREEGTVQWERIA